MDSQSLSQSEFAEIGGGEATIRQGKERMGCRVLRCEEAKGRKERAIGNLEHCKRRFVGCVVEFPHDVGLESLEGGLIGFRVDSCA